MAATDIAGAEIAARAAAMNALRNYNGNALTALRSIAPHIAALSVAEQRAIARRTFDGNSFLARLRAEIDCKRDVLLSRQVTTAFDRTNGDAAVRAIDSLARITDSYSTPKPAAAKQRDRTHRLGQPATCADCDKKANATRTHRLAFSI